MELLRKILKNQFCAALDMLRDAIRACPDDLWDDRREGVPFWHLAYHTLFYADLYLSESLEAFRPAEFHRELANFLRDVPFPPHRVETPAVAYSREQLMQYLAGIRGRCVGVFDATDEEHCRARCGFPWLDITVGDLFVYNMRHVQHHTGQLNLMLRRSVQAAPGWRQRGE